LPSRSRCWLGAALLNALVPLLFAAAIDHLSADRAALAVPIAILIACVLLQWLARVLNESRWALYGPIDQRLQRLLALRAIEHLHGISLRFHLGRRTGEISRILDNGLRGLREFLFDERPEVVIARARPLRPGPGAIAFEHVSFRYGTGRGTLEDVSFTVEPGRKVAIVGPTRAGKSGTARLLFRLYDPSAGRILIDGQNVSRLAQASARAAIALVPQRVRKGESPGRGSARAQQCSPSTRPGSRVLRNHDPFCRAGSGRRRGGDAE
jgi:ABC-type multidrug transport system fused ATPase/permease subunit